MAEFGHAYSSNGDAHIDSWGAGPFKIEVVAFGRSFMFEDSERFGPVPLKKNGLEIKAPGYFAENSMFWHAWERWKNQGRRVADNGVTCVWSHDE